MDTADNVRVCNENTLSRTASICAAALSEKPVQPERLRDVSVVLYSSASDRAFRAASVIETLYERLMDVTEVFSRNTLASYIT